MNDAAPVYLAAIKIFALVDLSILETHWDRTFSHFGRSIGLILSSSPQTSRESAGYHIIHAAWPIPIHYSLSRRDIKEMHYLYQDCWPFLLHNSFYCSPFRVTNIGWYVRSTLSIPVIHSAYAFHASAPYTEKLSYLWF